MYREMLSEFERIAQDLTPEQLEIVAAQVLEGLDKLAEAEDSLGEDNTTEPTNPEDKTPGEEDSGKEASEIASDDKVEKVADELADSLSTAEGVAVGAGALGALTAARKAYPGVRKDMLEGKKARLKSQTSRNLNAIEDINKQMRGLGAVPMMGEAAGATAEAANKPKFAKNLAPADRVTDKGVDGTPRHINDVTKDVNSLQAADFISKNKGKIAAGLGAGALLYGSHEQNERQKAELQGAYLAGRR